jgi:hypothetical protein
MIACAHHFARVKLPPYYRRCNYRTTDFQTAIARTLTQREDFGNTLLIGRSMQTICARENFKESSNRIVANNPTRCR